MAAHWTTDRERGSYWGMRVVLGFFRWFGARLCKRFIFPILIYFYWTNRRTRHALATYHKRLALYSSTAEQSHYKRRGGLRNVLNFGYAIVDRLSAWTGRFPFDRVVRHGYDEVITQINEKKGGIILVSHLGNFEMSRCVAETAGTVKLNIIVNIKNAKKINAILSLTQMKQTAEIIPVDRIDLSLAMKLHDKISEGEFIVIAGDRTMQDPTNTIELNFLGYPALFPTGPYLLAKILKVPLYTLFCIEEKGFYHVHFKKISLDVSFSKTSLEQMRPYVQAYVNELEHYCKQYPEQWYNFYPFWNEPLE